MPRAQRSVGKQDPSTSRLESTAREHLRATQAATAGALGALPMNDDDSYSKRNTVSNDKVSTGEEFTVDPSALVLTCANCGRMMDERKCKLICECGYFASCSDYY